MLIELIAVSLGDDHRFTSGQGEDKTRSLERSLDEFAVDCIVDAASDPGVI